MVTDAQVRVLRRKRMEGKTQETAAAAAGMSVRSASKWDAERARRISRGLATGALGAIQVERREVTEDPLRMRISDSVVDAMAPSRAAIGAAGKLCAYAALELHRCTIFGTAEAHKIELAEDSIFTRLIRACRRQFGCMRFCYVPPASRTPRRYECQPDLVLAKVAEDEARDALTRVEAAALRISETLRVRPEFESVRYGTPIYFRLDQATAPEITQGASDRSEMGVFHDLYQPQRAANLAQRLTEFTPAGTDAGIIYAS
jgi:hypothetical protein